MPSRTCPRTVIVSREELVRFHALRQAPSSRDIVLIVTDGPRPMKFAADDMPQMAVDEVTMEGLLFDDEREWKCIIHIPPTVPERGSIPVELALNE